MTHDSTADRLSPHGDEFYSSLIAMHEGLSFEDSADLNARLILILANIIGDIGVLKTALQEARKVNRPK
jgi:hypothetical protein